MIDAKLCTYTDILYAEGGISIDRVADLHEQLIAKAENERRAQNDGNQ